MTFAIIGNNIQVMNGNKTEKRQIGDAGEEIAAGYLTEHGYQIIARNFSCKAGETDIIAQKGNVIVFAEVKTRKSTLFGLACEAVDAKKQRRLLICAQLFLKMNPRFRYCSPRMDIIEVYRNNGFCRVNHIENAFGN